MSDLTDWARLHGEAFRGTRALVTGGAGFIGSHLVEALSRLGAEVLVVDDLSGGSAGNLEGTGARLVRASILDADALRDAAAGRDVVFHLAALGSVPHSVERPRDYHEVDATGTLAVLEAARAAGARRVVYSASSSAYGDAPALPKVETMDPRPLSPYAAAKLAGEAYVRAYAACYGLDGVSLRYFNIFGPRQNANSAYAAVIAAFASALLAGRAATIFGDGAQSRDFTFVDNAVHANLLAARAVERLEGMALNVATGMRISVATLADEMAAALGRRDLPPVHAPPRAGDVLHSQADLSAIRARLGYEPVVDFARGLRATLAWYASARS